MYKFVPNKLFGQLLDHSREKFIFLKTFDSEFSYIEVWFTDQDSKPLEIKDKINIILFINQSEMRYSVQPGDQIIAKGYGFLSFAR